MGIEWFEPQSKTVAVIPSPLLCAWTGAESNEPGVPGKDWGRACETSGLIDSLTIGEGYGLILNEYPVAAFTEKDGDLHLLRWVCADGESDILSLFNTAASPKTDDKIIKFIHPGGRLCMIDALDSGSELSYQPLTTELPPGKYAIESYTLKASKAELIVHRFRRAE